MDKLPKQDTMIDVKWLAGWYASRLHAIRVEEAPLGDQAAQSLCGAWVYKNAKSKYAQKRIDKGVKRCIRCERLLA